MENSYFFINLPLSVVVGGLLGYLWVVKTGRPRSVWAMIVSALVMVVSPWLFSGWKIISLFGVGIKGNYLVLGLTLVIVVMTAVRFVRREQKPQPIA